MIATSDNWHLPDPVTHAEFYADVPAKRLGAFIIDSILIILITLILIPLTAFTALFFIGFLTFLVGIIYRTLTLATRSATPGMRLLSIEFRNHHGERLGLGTAFIHTMMFSICMSMVLPQIISIVLMLTTGRAQGLTDFFLGTVVINKTAAT